MCFLPEARFPFAAILRLTGRLAVALALGHAAAAWPQQVNLTLEDLEAPGFAAKALKASLHGDAELGLLIEIGTVTIRGRSWRNVRISCPRLRLEPALIECADGVLDAGGKVPIAFAYAAKSRMLNIALNPAQGETWRLAARFGTNAGGGDFRITVDGGRLDRLAPWLPPAVPKPGAGTLKGAIAFNATTGVTAQLAVEGLGFSDAGGLHAGEKINAGIEVHAEQRDAQWQWRANLAWTAGGVFWQPLYVTGVNQRLSAEGVYDTAQVRVRRGTLAWPGIGDLEIEAAWDQQAGKLIRAMVRSAQLRAAPLYAYILKPFLEPTVLGDLRTEGDIALVLQLEQDAVHALEVRFSRVSLEDRSRRFALFDVNGVIPWRRDAATTADVEVQGGEILRLPFGAFRLPLRMRGTRLAIDRVDVPLLDGALTIKTFTTGEARDGWRWRFSGGIAPISVTRLTQSVGLPTMHGTLSAEIPQVIYRQSTLVIDGALVFKAFDGTIVAKALKLIDPFGKAPRAEADLDMRNLDLDLLTRTFSFGNITGRIDAQVAGLELANWQPVKFDARVASSAGEYPRRISQAAVQNISALGGAGAAAAIQRSFLRFFEQFGYEKLGLSCRLRNNVCEMDGVESAPQGYVIVKGGGIPAISVIGYNRHVNWQELIDRLKRIMQDNVRAIIE